jgi:hypothetical protein
MWGQDRTFPRWYAPILCSLLGVVAAAEATRDKGIDQAQAIALGWLGGFIFGLLIFLLDPPAADFDDDANLSITALARRGNLVTRLLAVLSVALMWLPLGGSIFGIAAIVANWHATGWPRTASIVGFIVSLLPTAAGIIGLYMRK